MAAPANADAFLDLVRRSELIPADRLDAFLAQNELPKAAQQAADRLVEAGLLTAYQAQNLLAGKHKGFRLGPYRLLQPIGKGGMGTVYLAEHTSLRRRVAVKVLPPNLARDEACVKRFYREGRAAAALDHPNVIRVHDIAQEGNIHFLVMEYGEGKTLDTLLRKSGPLPIGRAVDYAVQVAAGLQHAAEHGVVHRDIKPSNLLVDAQGTIKILDMGLARFFDKPGEDVTRQHDDGSVLGTLDYIAPEQAMSSQSVDNRADIYSLGATLYALLGGKPPFSSKSSIQKLLAHQFDIPRPLDEVRPEVPHALAAVVEKMMAKKPEDRYQTPAEVIDALTRFADGPDTSDPATSETVRIQRATRVETSEADWEGLTLPWPGTAGRRRLPLWPVVLAGTAAVGLLALCIVTGLGWWLLADPTPDPSPDLVVAPGPPAPPAPKPEHATPAAAVAAPPSSPPGPPEPLYRLDLTGRPLRTWKRARTKTTKQPAAKPPPGAPPGWNTVIRETNSSSLFLLSQVQGYPALGLRNLTGKKAGVWVLERPAQPGGRRYHLHLAYMVRDKGRCVISLKPQNRPTRELASLGQTNGRWRQVRVYFELDAAGPFRLEFHNPSQGEENTLHFRDVCITDAGAMNEDYVVARQDWRGVAPFLLVFKGQAEPERRGQLPARWSVPNRQLAIKGEVILEEVEGRPAVALRDREGNQPLILSWSGHQFRQGRNYWAVVDYHTEGGASGLVRMRQGTAGWIDVGPLPPTAGRWQTARLPFKVPKDTTAAIGLSMRGPGLAAALHVGRIELIEARTGR